jgi:hypothetical protein
MKTFADLIDEAMRRKGWGYGRLSVKLGELPDGSILNATQIRRLRRGQRQNLTPELVQRLIDVLGLDPAEAWHAAGLWPPDLSADDYRVFAAVGGAAASAASVQALGTKRKTSPYALRLVRAA